MNRLAVGLNAALPIRRSPPNSNVDLLSPMPSHMWAGNPTPQWSSLRSATVRHCAHNGKNRCFGYGNLAVYAGAPCDHTATRGEGSMISTSQRKSFVRSSNLYESLEYLHDDRASFALGNVFV